MESRHNEMNKNVLLEFLLFDTFSLFTKKKIKMIYFIVKQYKKTKSFGTTSNMQIIFLVRNCVLVNRIF